MDVIPVPLAAKNLPSRRHRGVWGELRQLPSGRVERTQWPGQTCSGREQKPPHFHLRLYGQTPGSDQIQETIYR